eukprot:2004501-Lingulodinium_polyedra.AAC.1
MPHNAGAAGLCQAAGRREAGRGAGTERTEGGRAEGEGQGQEMGQTARSVPGRRAHARVQGLQRAQRPTRGCEAEGAEQH